MTEYHAMINGVEVTAYYSDSAVKKIFIPLLERLADLRRRKGGRILVMLAAPPGCGKTTLLAFLEKLSRERTGLTPVQAIGMDGFHRKQAYLMSHTLLMDGGQVPMIRVKGAPATFDLDRLEESVRKVAAGEKCGWPAYDRLLHDPVEDALLVDGDIVMLEGNYLLLDEDGWRGLAPLADYTVSVAAEEALLRSRLIDRKIRTGRSEAEAVRFVDFSDMPNVRLCLEKTMRADLRLRIGPDGDYSLE